MSPVPMLKQAPCQGQRTLPLDKTPGENMAESRIGAALQLPPIPACRSPRLSCHDLARAGMAEASCPSCCPGDGGVLGFFTT